MRKLLYTLTILVCILAFTTNVLAVCGKPKPAWLSSSDAYFKAGYLNVLLYASQGYTVDPTGVLDSTAAFNAALIDSMEYALPVTAPAGSVFKISNTVYAENLNPNPANKWWQWNDGCYFWKGASLVGPNSGTRPKFVLANSSSGFNNVASPKPVVHFVCLTPHDNHPEPIDEWEGADINFRSIIKNWDIEIGTGNAGAIAIRNPSAQGAYMENIKITTTGTTFWAGISGHATTNVMTNIEVVGGKYGIDVTYDNSGVCYAGVKLTNQTDVAINMVNLGTGQTTIVGAEIVKATSPVITFGAYWCGDSLTLIDAKITVISGTTAVINNTGGRNLYLNNVYFNSGAPLIKSGSEAAVTTSGYGTWDQVNEYSYTDKSSKLVTGSIYQTAKNMINGVAGQATQISITRDADPPSSSIVTRHIPPAIPNWNDSGVANIETLGCVSDGVTNCHAIIQSAIDNYQYVFIPRGQFAIGAPITLKENTVMFGVPGEKSRIYVNWNPGGVITYPITTVDSATATTTLEDVEIDVHAGAQYLYFGMINWRAGRNSLIRHVLPARAWNTEPVDAQAVNHILVSGNGGGRFYGTRGGMSTGSDDPNYRYLKTLNTTQPLSVYGQNVEYSLANAGNTEFSGSSNIRMFGMKDEPNSSTVANSSFWITNGSSNIGIFGSYSNTADGTDGVVKMADSNNITLANITIYSHPWWNPSRYFLKYFTGASLIHSTPQTTQTSLYKNGTFNMSVWNVEAPSSPVIDIIFIN